MLTKETWQISRCVVSIKWEIWFKIGSFGEDEYILDCLHLSQQCKDQWNDMLKWSSILRLKWSETTNSQYNISAGLVTHRFRILIQPKSEMVARRASTLYYSSDASRVHSATKNKTNYFYLVSDQGLKSIKICGVCKFSIFKQTSILYYGG